jgi:hypothetical protein
MEFACLGLRILNDFISRTMTDGLMHHFIDSQALITQNYDTDSSLFFSVVDDASYRDHLLLLPVMQLF